MNIEALLISADDTWATGWEHAVLGRHGQKLDTHIFTKLELTSRAAATAFAYENGLVSRSSGSVALTTIDVTHDARAEELRSDVPALAHRGH